MADDNDARLAPYGAELDEGLYELSDDEASFLMQETGISDAEELKKHVIDIQHEVYAVHPYPCIRVFHFVKLKTCNYSIYPQVLQLARTRPGALYLDVGCCVGNDIRKLVADGWPATQVIGSDIEPDFWATGHKVFKSNPESFPAIFIPGDIFDKSFLESGPPASELPEGVLDLSSSLTTLTPLPLTTLTPLRGRLSVIHASSFFHLFTEQKQTELAHLLTSLLSPEPGSLIFGGHVGRPEKGPMPEALMRQNPARVQMFCHCPESIDALWIEVFGAGKVEVGSSIAPAERKDTEGLKERGIIHYWLTWWVKRL